MIDKLEMFVALAREGHFGRAAEAHGVAQPTLSSAIRALEDQLGVQLVWRGSRYHGLTPEGQRVLERARGIVAEARALRDEMRAARHGEAGKLRIGVVPTALARVARLTLPFLQRNPGASVAIFSRSSAEIREGIEAQAIDAGISYLDAVPPARLAQVPLYHERYRLVERGSDGGAIGWAEAAARPLCLLTPDMQNRRGAGRGVCAAARLRFAPACSARGAPPRRPSGDGARHPHPDARGTHRRGAAAGGGGLIANSYRITVSTN